MTYYASATIGGRVATQCEPLDGNCQFWKLRYEMISKYDIEMGLVFDPVNRRFASTDGKVAEGFWSIKPMPSYTTQDTSGKLHHCPWAAVLVCAQSSS